MTSERAEVARSIRATVGDASACNGLHHLWRAVTGETAPELDREARGELFLTLADLIEPEPERTCHEERTDRGGVAGVPSPVCSECGAQWAAGRYCPNCGARVVSG